MSLLVCIRKGDDIPAILRWGRAFARARNHSWSVAVIDTEVSGEMRKISISEPPKDCPFEMRRVADHLLQWKEKEPAPEEEAEDEKAWNPRPEACLLVPDQPPWDATLEVATECKASLIVVGLSSASIRAQRTRVLEELLLRRASCQVLVLDGKTLDSAESHLESPRILVPLSEGGSSTEALKLGRDLVGEEGKLDALWVQDNIGRDAHRLGRRILKRSVHQSLGDNEGVGGVVRVGSDIGSEIADHAKAQSYDLVFMGVPRTEPLRKGHSGAIINALLNGETSFAAIRPAFPWRNRILSAIDRTLRRRIPQMDRDARLELADRVYAHSQWDFDFVALVALSTMIAAWGLLADSAAVVIGAMLIAPLMTPLIGAGMGLVQGNHVLLQKAIRSLILGFVLAIGLAALIGAFAPSSEPTSEMLARGKPGMLDLLVAFVSGLAAAYALSRRQLSAALPGVAIAAALVPPIATSGMAFARGELELGTGALILFLTNIVAIILAGSLSLWLVGMKPPTHASVLRRWVPPLLISLLVMMSLVSLTLGRFGQRAQAEDLRTALSAVIMEHGGRLLDYSIHEGPTLSEVHILVNEATREDVYPLVLECCRDTLEENVRVEIQRAWIGEKAKQRDS